MKVVEEPILADGMNKKGSNSLPRKIETERNRKGGTLEGAGREQRGRGENSFSGLAEKKNAKKG